MVRRKVEIKKIEDKAKRHTTFTKRRQGLFKKANELTSKCGDDVAIITFSLAGNMYAFGHPSVESIVRRFENTEENDRADNTVIMAGGEEDEETDNNNVGEEEEEEYEEEEEEEIEGGEVVVVKEEGEELAELDQLEAAAEEMLKKVSVIAKHMVDKM